MSNFRRSCVVCVRDKSKCDFNFPCARCIRKGVSVQCLPAESKPRQPACAPCKQGKRTCDRKIPCGRCVRLRQEERCFNGFEQGDRERTDLKRRLKVDGTDYSKRSKFEDIREIRLDGNILARAETGRFDTQRNLERVLLMAREFSPKKLTETLQKSYPVFSYFGVIIAIYLGTDKAAQFLQVLKDLYSFPGQSSENIQQFSLNIFSFSALLPGFECLVRSLWSAAAQRNLDRETYFLQEVFIGVPPDQRRWIHFLLNEYKFKTISSTNAAHPKFICRSQAIRLESSSPFAFYLNEAAERYLGYSTLEVNFYADSRDPPAMAKLIDGKYYPPPTFLL